MQDRTEQNMSQEKKKQTQNKAKKSINVGLIHSVKMAKDDSFFLMDIRLRYIRFVRLVIMVKDKKLEEFIQSMTLCKRKPSDPEGITQTTADNERIVAK